MIQVGALAIMVLSAAALVVIEYTMGGNIAYRIAYQSIVSFLLINAAVIWSARGSAIARAMFWFNIAAATMFGFWWLFNYMDRPTWMRDHWYWVFLVGAAGTMATLGNKLLVFSTVQGRERVFIAWYVGAFLLACAMNWWPQEGIMSPLGR